MYFLKSFKKNETPLVFSILGAVITSWLLDTLSENGLHASALRVATQTTYPRRARFIKIRGSDFYNNKQKTARAFHPRNAGTFCVCFDFKSPFVFRIF